MIVLTYDHNARAITMHRENSTTEIGVEKARKLWDAGKVTDCNVAFSRLASADFDMDEVERQYRELDGCS